MTVEEQQRLVVARTARLLTAGKPPPEPPVTGLEKNRAGLRDEVHSIVYDQLLYEVDGTVENDRSVEIAQRYENQKALLGKTSHSMRTVSLGLETRVEHRDYLNIEAADEELAKSLREAVQVSKAADVAMEAMNQAPWILDPPEVRQRNDLDRERRLYDDARELIAADPLMKQDFDSLHVGEVKLPTRDREGGEMSEAENEAFLAKIRERDENAKQLREARALLADTQAKINVAEDEVRTMATALEKYGRSMGFDARVRERKKMMAKKSEADELAVALAEQKQSLEKLRPDVGPGGGSGRGGGMFGGAGNEFDSTKSTRNLVVWLMGVTDGVNIGKCYFGCYAQGDVPPTEYWLPFVDDERGSKLSIHVKEGSMAGTTVLVEDTHDPALGGKYNQDGACDDVPKYTNSEGISLFRARLHETPELLITNLLLSLEAPGQASVAAAAAKAARQKAELEAEYGGGGGGGGGTGGTGGGGSSSGVPHLPQLLSLEERKKRALAVTDLAGEAVDHQEPRALQSVGLRMIVVSLRDQVTRRLKHKAEMERLIEGEFNKERERAASELKAVQRGTGPPVDGGDGGGGGGGSGGGGGGDGGDDGFGDDSGGPVEEKIDYSALMMKTPNTTFMLSEADVLSRLPGSDRVIPTHKTSVPPLCRAWVMLSCPHNKAPHHCKSRHYYVNEVERTANGEARSAKEHGMDMDALLNVSTREALLESVKREGQRSMTNFLHDTESAGVERRHVEGLLAMLDRLRLTSVACVESIGRWRVHQEAMRSIGGSDGGSDLKGWWSVTVKVIGPELYKASAAFRSKVKRLQRDRQEAVKAVEYHYLGVYPTKSDAARVYDEYIAAEAGRKGTNPVSGERERRERGGWWGGNNRVGGVGGWGGGGKS
jgi:hypothetical protein